MKFFIIAAIVAVVAADSYKAAYQAPEAYAAEYAAPAYKAQTYAAPAYEYVAQPYNYAYDIKDDYYYNNFGQQETSDGKVVSGSYHVALPDGRIQTVSYKADSYGYVADVKYSGEAKYPEYKEYKSAPAAYEAPKAYAAEYKPAYAAPAYKAEY